MAKKFNSKNWQGRSQKQIESNYKVMGYGCMFTLALFVLLGVINTIKNLFF